MVRVVFNQAPFRALNPAPVPHHGSEDVGVVVPTRDRPDRLARCLAALASARDELEFQVYVCDSSHPDGAAEVVRICDEYPFVELVTHSRVGAAAARNVGTERCREELVVTVDDDVYVDSAAIRELLAVYNEHVGIRVVAGTVDWGSWESRPLVMRSIGYPRAADPGEDAEVLISALLLYPRALGIGWPWNERLWPYDDFFASHLWRLAGAKLISSGGARARHDREHSRYTPAHAADHIYTNLFDAVLADPSARRLLAFETIGFAAYAKQWLRSPGALLRLAWAWLRGHVAFARDFRALRRASRTARAAADVG